MHIVEIGQRNHEIGQLLAGLDRRLDRPLEDHARLDLAAHQRRQQHLDRPVGDQPYRSLFTQPDIGASELPARLGQFSLGELAKGPVDDPLALLRAGAGNWEAR